MYSKEEIITFEVQANAVFAEINEEPIDGGWVKAEIQRLFNEVVDPAIREEYRAYGQKNELFRLTAQVVRPQAIKHYKLLLERQNSSTHD